MAKKPSAKVLERYLIRQVMLLEDNMLQWAQADVYLGLEKGHRLEQVLALKTRDMDKVVTLHNQRIYCLQKALEILTTCPACEGHGPPTEEKPDDNDQT